MLATGPAGPTGPNDIDELMARLTARVAALMNVKIDDLDENEELMDQGLDSVRLVEVVSFLREQGYHTDFADLAEDSSLSGWRDLLVDLTA